MITEERMQRLTDYLGADKDRAARLLSLPAEEALPQINADGNDFTIQRTRRV